ncbi:MAG: hypothetical protein ABMA64_03990 [Myxococcota bacterium]
MLVGWFSLAACVRDLAMGPDLGACAELPEGPYGFGDAGIGSCLAGPADLSFFQQDGGTFLAVTNADPYREFQSGSVLLLDWDDLASRFLDTADRPLRVTMDQLEAHRFDLLDDDDGDGEGSNPFFGGFGYVPARSEAVVTSRYSETGILRTGKDEAFVLDLKDMELPGGGIRFDGAADTLTLEDDPFPVVVDSVGDRVYVGNLTDHSVSVLSTSGAAIHEIDVATGPTSTLAPMIDVDGSGSLGAVSALTVTDGSLVFDDTWSLTFVEQTVRLWVAAPIDAQTDGLHLYTTGDTQNYQSSVFPLESGLGGDVRGPFVEVDANGLAQMYFSRSTDGNVYRAVASTYGGNAWLLDSSVVLVGLGQLYGSVSLAPLPGATGLFVDVRDTENGPARIGVATSADGVTFDYVGEVLRPTEGASYEDPFVAFDARAGRYRMWLTVRRGEVFQVALSESEDGLSWTPPVPVIDNADGYLYAAPTVTSLEGRYGMWLSRTDGAVWDTAFSWSYDGWHWTEPVLVVPGALEYRAIHPPRAAVQVDPAGGWRLEGASAGSVTGLLVAGSEPIPVGEYEIAVTNGQEVDNDVIPDRAAERALVPGSAAQIDGSTVLFASAVSAGGAERLVALRRGADGWEPLLGPDALADQLGLDAGEGASDPVIASDGSGFVLFYSRTGRDGTSRIRRATSPDGLDWSGGTEVTLVLPDGDEVAFDAAGQQPHSIEVTADGVWLWYSGFDGSVERIGAATAPDLRGVFAREAGDREEWVFGTGAPGGFDDTLVRDPLVVDIDGVTHLYYAGYDGETWRTGHAERLEDGTFVRRLDPIAGVPRPSMGEVGRSFAALGADGPVLLGRTELGLEIAYAGYDGVARRLGLAVVPIEAPDEMFPTPRFPTAGDTMGFETHRSAGEQVIELGQTTETFSVPGWGMSSMALDTERGFLFVTTKLDDGVFVIDVRDDSDGAFVDGNYLDLEALLQVDSGSGSAGFRDAVISPSRGLMYLTQRVPDGLVIVDLNRIPDDAEKEMELGAPVAVLPLQSLGDDAGVESYATIGGAGMALTADERYLLITHFRGNGLSVYDLERGLYGEEIAWLPNLGENPHAVEISPDGRWAVVANYLGEVDGETVSSTLTVVDLDPDSETYLEAVTWLANH